MINLAGLQKIVSGDLIQRENVRKVLRLRIVYRERELKAESNQNTIEGQHMRLFNR